MKKSATVLALAATFLFASALTVSAHTNDRDHDRDYRRDNLHHYNWQPERHYNQVVTTPYWCGIYYSSQPCSVYYPPQPYANNYYTPATYPYYQSYGQYYNNLGYYNGGAWTPYYGY